MLTGNLNTPFSSYCLFFSWSSLFCFFLLSLYLSFSAMLFLFCECVLGKTQRDGNRPLWVLHSPRPSFIHSRLCVYGCAWKCAYSATERDQEKRGHPTCLFLMVMQLSDVRMCWGIVGVIYIGSASKTVEGEREKEKRICIIFLLYKSECVGVIRQQSWNWCHTIQQPYLSPPHTNTCVF